MALTYAPKLRLAPLWPALAAIAVVAALAALLLPRPLVDVAKEELRGELRLFASALAWPQSPDAAAADGSLQRRVVELSAGTPYRITVIALDGRVLADSGRRADEVAGMENHAGRTEVRAALDRGDGTASRRSDTTGIEMLYAARLVHDAEGNRWILRLSKPLSTLAALQRELRRILLVSILAAAALVLVVSWWLTGTLFSPLSRLISAADDMGNGDYGVAIDLPAQSELHRLGVALRRIARRAGEQIAAVGSERDHLRATVAGMAEGVLVTDGDGDVRLVNPSFKELLGVAADAPPEQVLALAREPALEDLIVRAAERGIEARAEVERQDPERGTERAIAFVASPLAGREGVVLVARDTTESERLDRMRRDFVANVSHELRTPLAAIRGYAETLVDGAAAEAETAQRFSQRIFDQCRRLGALLDDLLTLSRLEGTAAPAARNSVDLRELVIEAVDRLRPAAEAKQVALVVEPGVAPVVEGDEDGLLRLISNLLDNAIKYNRPGGSVRARLTEGQGQIALEVEDDGIGIPAASLPRIFERFYRVDKGRSREEGGTGLGLAIVKHVAQSHGGKVDVESRVGEGTRFRVVLPRPAAAA